MNKEQLCVHACAWLRHQVLEHVRLSPSLRIQASLVTFATAGKCMPWLELLDHFCFLSACPRSVSVAVWLILACFVLLVGASVADAAVPVGELVFAAGLVHSCLRPLSLPPSSRVAKRCPRSFRSFGGAEAEAPLGLSVVPDSLFLFF
jgi:hypothetical protein